MGRRRKREDNKRRRRRKKEEEKKKKIQVWNSCLELWFGIHVEFKYGIHVWNISFVWNSCIC